MTDVLARETAYPSAAPRRGRSKRVLAFALVGALFVAGVIGWAVLSDNGPSEPPAFLSPCGTVIHSQGPTRVRLLLVADSIMSQPSSALAGILAQLGVETHIHAVSCSGLLTGAID